MVQLIISYLVEPEIQHLNTFYYRPTNSTQQFWTFPFIPGKRKPDIPVYVLTGKNTASAAEEFAYNLKSMKRAKLIGETTQGAAHPVTKELILGTFDVRLPYGRPINPVTGTNWEGKGVEPDTIVHEESALMTAHLAAIENLHLHSKSIIEQQKLIWISEIVSANYSPIKMGEEELPQFTGEFGKINFFLKGGGLYYQHQDLSEAWELIPIGKNRFRLDNDLKFEFIFNQTHSIDSVKIFFADNREEKTISRNIQ
jgi:hypothetical protein